MMERGQRAKQRRIRNGIIGGGGWGEDWQWREMEMELVMEMVVRCGDRTFHGDGDGDGDGAAVSVAFPGRIFPSSDERNLRRGNCGHLFSCNKIIPFLDIYHIHIIRFC